jgi:broad specificity phosphatase PhoE
VAVASDLARAFETAQIVLGTRSSILTADPRWRELRFGAWEGLTRPEIVARTPALRANPPARFPTPEGGESFVELVVRVRAALHAVADRTPGGGHALVATHAGPLHAALRLLLGEEEANGLGVTFLPATFTSLAVAPHGSRLIELNRSAS